MAHSMPRNYFVMFLENGTWVQFGYSHHTADSARAALKEYRRGPQSNGVFRVIQVIEEVGE